MKHVCEPFLEREGAMLTALEKSSVFPKWYWNDREREETIAVAGIAERFDEIPSKEILDEGARFVGAVPFAKGQPPFFFRPAIELGEREAPISSLPKIRLLYKVDSPSYPDWEKKVEGLLEKIESGEVEKVVLARKSSLYFDRKIDPYRVLHNLLLEQPGIHFLLQLDEESVFLGATPERLYSREGNELIIDSLAGSCPRGANREADDDLEQMLLKSTKELREFACVRDDLLAKMGTISHEVRTPSGVEVLKLPHIQHLRQKIEALIDAGVSDKELIALLHPTAAMGGLPRSSALALLKELEPFQRNWYAAPFGWITKDRSEFAVAIRSAEIEGNVAHVFAATGIVAGSDPKREWEELNCKIEGMVNALLF